MATYYLDESGIDDAGRDGLSTETAWASLSYALNSRLTSGTHTLHINAGTYIEDYTCDLAVGISLEGEGDTSIITSNNTISSWYLFNVYSGDEGTEGNHLIKDLKFDGNNKTISFCFRIRCRSNIEFNNCTFVDWEYAAIDQYGSTSTASEPSVYSTGIKYIDCYFYDASGCTTPGSGWSGQGAINFGGTDGMIIENCDIIQPLDPSGPNGIPLNTVRGYNKGLKIYDSTLHKISGSSDKAFCLESWDCRGDLEIYNCDIIGDIDLVRTDKGSLGFGAKIHHNRMGPSSVSNIEYPALSLEHYNYGIYCYDNIIENSTNILAVSTGGGGGSLTGNVDCHIEDIYFYNNIAKNIGPIWNSCTFTDSTDAINDLSHGLSNGDRVRLYGTLPPNLSSTVTYYVINSLTNTFQVSTTSGGSAVNFGGDGSGYWCENVYCRSIYHGSVDYGCSFQAATDTIYDSDKNMIVDGTRIKLSGTLPSPFNTTTIYYARNNTSTTFQLSETIDGSIITFTSDGTGTYIPIPILSNIHYCNNIIEGVLAPITQSGFYFELSGELEDMYIKNNIILNMTIGPIWGRQDDCSFTNFEIENNIFYNCGNSNDPYYDYGFTGGTNYIYDGTIKLDPLFVGGSPYDYHIQSTSPAKYAGVVTDLFSEGDYAGNAWNSSPSIGIYEYYENVHIPYARFKKWSKI